MNNCLVLKGNICHTPGKKKIETVENGYVVSVDGISQGIFRELPEQYRGFPCRDFKDALILPGMVDLHTHASQFAYRGLGMDDELMVWLRKRAFPEESKFADIEYAKKAYSIFADSLKRSATTRAVIFATIHREATMLLMELLEETGIVSLVGKVNMNRNAPKSLCEPKGKKAAEETVRWIEEALAGDFRHTFPIVTPRFIPSCTDDFLEALGKIARKYDLPVQSHLSENPDEGKFVAELMPDIAFYGEGYDRYGLFGKEVRTVMAHCVYSCPEEMELMKKNGIWIAHCPNSNMNIRSGIAPIRRYVDSGLKVGLASDVAGGMTLSIFRAITEAVQMSKMYWRLVNQDEKALTFPEAFYLATKGGGSFFGKVGSFEKGYAMDAIVIDDAHLPRLQEYSLKERLERAVNLGLDQGYLRAKYVEGRECLCTPDKT